MNLSRLRFSAPNSLHVNDIELPKMTSDQIEFLLEVIRETSRVDFADIDSLISSERERNWFNKFPGEHYKFLAALSKVMNCKQVIEIGTFKGLGSLALSKFSESVITYDIVRLEMIQGHIANLQLRKPNVKQIIGDLSEDAFFLSQEIFIAGADLIFVDGPKNKLFEEKLIPKLEQSMKPGSILVIDDIRFKIMRNLWIKLLTKPRIDMGDFAHFSGTGLVFI